VVLESPPRFVSHESHLRELQTRKPVEINKTFIFDMRGTVRETRTMARALVEQVINAEFYHAAAVRVSRTAST